MRKRGKRSEAGDATSAPASPSIPYRLILESKATGEQHIAEGRIPGVLWETLVAFREETDRLRECVWLKSNLKGSYALKYDDGVASVELKDPPADVEIAQVLHVLRPFLLQSERLYFPRVSGHLYEAIGDPGFRMILAYNRASFQSRIMRHTFRVTRNDLELNSEQAFDLWIDAFEYHRHGKDPSRRQRFIELNGGPPDDLGIAVFQDMLRDRILAILGLANFVQSLEQSPTVTAFFATQSSKTPVESPVAAADETERRPAS